MPNFTTLEQLQKIQLVNEWGVNATVEDHEIEIVKTIFFDGLSKHVLFETIGDIRVAHDAINNTFKKLQKPERPE
jgi:hypothetical protein